MRAPGCPERGIQQDNQGEVMCSSWAEGTDTSLLFWPPQRIQGEEPKGTKKKKRVGTSKILPSCAEFAFCSHFGL